MVLDAGQGAVVNREASPGHGITQEQWEELKAALRLRGIPASRLLDHYEIDRAHKLPLARFQEAMALIQAPQSVLLARPAASA